MDANWLRIEEKEFGQLLTSITTYTKLKSFHFKGIRLSPDIANFLRFWYKDPFGHADIPSSVVDEKEKQTKAGKCIHVHLKRKLINNDYILISQYKHNK